jgi:hypothetical protein
MAFFNNKISSRRSQAPAAAAAEVVPVPNDASESLARQSFTRPVPGSAKGTNPFAKKSNPFAPQVAQPIQHDPGVIDMSSNPITEQSLSNIRNKLNLSDGRQVVVTKLILREAEVTQQTAAFIARTLEANNTLHELDLSFNPIGSIGASAISEMLKVIYLPLFDVCLVQIGI